MAILLETESCNALNKAFLTATLLTKSIKRAEEAVLDGISALDVDDLPSEKLLLRTIEGIISGNGALADPAAEEIEEASAILPFELQNLLRMPRRSRFCYVLRILAGVPSESCGAMLHWDRDQVDKCISAAMFNLAGQAGTYCDWQERQLAFLF
ncbi:MAG TPA: hypothetical protein VK604_22540 [Bryobacteraceae bacterium]|nr:hypothetical protein [Bryobacteraceae bacterium]